MQKKAVLVSLLVVGAALVLFHQPIIQMIESISQPRDSRPSVGSIEDIAGDTDIRMPDSLNPEPAKKGQAVRHQDTITTGNGARAIVRLKGGLAIELEPETSLVFELIDHTLITVQRGNFKIIEKGSVGHEVVILKDGVLQDPEGRTIPAANLLKADAGDAEPEASTAPTPPPDDGSTLSDAYISSVVQSKKGFMNRCYAQALRNNPGLSGQIHLTFSIAPNGDVSSLKVLKSTINDGDLQKCVLSVLERARFRSFTGDPVVVNYPIYFE